MWYVSFRGEPSTSGGAGAGGAATPPPVNNILVYHDDGKPHDPPELLPTGGSNPALQELRGFALRGPQLYVVNGFKSDSQILLYQQGPGGYAFDRVFASPSTVNSILHPFDLSFDTRGRCYVSSQDTNVVTGLFPNGAAQTVSQVLTQQFPPPARFLAGTVVASSVGALPNVPPPPPPDVPAPLGLQVQRDTTTGKVTNSVRGVVSWGSILLVADEPAGAVKAYEAGTGTLIGQIADDALLKAPIHLLLDWSTTTLYIGSTGTDSVVKYDLSKGLGSPTRPVTPLPFIEGSLKHVSGLAFDAHGVFYAAERKSRKIKKFQADGTPAGDFITNLPDEPEFIQYVPKSS